MIGRLFKLHSKKKHADSLANYLPNGNPFFEKFNDDAELRKLLVGLAGELSRAEMAVSEQFEQRDITKTVDLITEWERALGIPDSCFPGTGPIEERRNHVLIKFTMSVQTKEDFERIGKLLGYNDIEVTPLSQSAYPPYDVPFFPKSLPESRFISVVRGTNILPTVPPYNVPFQVKSGSSIIVCLFNKLKPANVKFIYEERA